MSQFVVVQSGYQIEPQSKSAAAVAVAFGDNPKDFQTPNHVFNHNALTRQLPIYSALVCAQLAAFWLLDGRLRVLMDGWQTLITRIAKQPNVISNRKSAFFEHGKIVRFADCLPGANNLARLLFNDNLRFYRVPLFLATVVSALFFFGRSIGVSVTSTTINSKVFSLARKTFLPGSWRSVQFFKRFSILRIVRETVASDTCHRLAIWNCVGYSRQYSSMSNTWSSTDSLHGLPDFFCTRVRSSRTNSQILAKVSGLTPQYRLKSSGDSDLICSKLIKLLMSENAYVVKQLMQEVYYGRDPSWKMF